MHREPLTAPSKWANKPFAIQTRPTHSQTFLFCMVYVMLASNTSIESQIGQRASTLRTARLREKSVKGGQSKTARIHSCRSHPHFTIPSKVSWPEQELKCRSQR